MQQGNSNHEMTVSLLTDPPSAPPESEKKCSDPPKSFQFGYSLLLSTLQGILLSKLLILGGTGEAESGAATLISSVQALVLGAGVGFMGAAGQIMQRPAYKTGESRRNMANTQLLIGGGLGIVSAGVLIGVSALLQEELSPETGKPAAGYFLGYAAANVPTFLMTALSTYGRDYAWTNMAWQTITRSANLSLCYLLNQEMRLGPAGVGWGQTLIGWVNMLAYVTFLKYKIKDLPLCTKPTEFFKHGRAFAKLGLKMSFQRSTEWGNWMLYVLKFISDSRTLAALNPAFQIGWLANMISYGYGQGLAMTLINGGVQEKVRISASQKKEIGMTLMRAIALNAVVSVAALTAADPLTQWFLSAETDPGTQQEARLLLILNAVSLVPDTLRIMSSCALNTWGEIVKPNVNNTLWMSVLGFGLPALANCFMEVDPSVYFIVRLLTMTLAALHNTYFLWQKMAIPATVGVFRDSENQSYLAAGEAEHLISQR